MKPGPHNAITDVAGLRVGHHERRDDGWLTGVTVVVAPPGGAAGGVDVRGGGPGTRETDVLDPRNLVDRVDAIVLGGGSAYGLAAATGVMGRLADDGRGFRVGPAAGEVVPIVPAAVLFDLGRGGSFRNTPDAGFGAAAYDAAVDGPVRLGTVGAGTGAVAGGLKGGVGSASVVVDGVTVGALAVVNSAGFPIDVATGALLGAQYGLEGEFAGFVARPLSGLGGPARSFNTTIGVVATDATLTKAQCQKMAGVAHDGLARAIRPVHSMVDGDTIFVLATGAGPAPALPAYNDLLAAAADTFSRAVAHGMLAATSAGGFPSLGEAADA
jgi:putative pantetheine hydrolase